jgi:type I restriction enzyme, S subunit
VNGEAGRWVLPESWVWTTMGEVAEIVGGSTPTTDEPENFASSGIPWITPADLSGYKAKLISRGSRDISEDGLATSSTRLMPAGTVLFSSRAPIGYVAIAANPVTTNQGFKSFVLFPKGILPDYTYYWLIRAKDLLSEYASGTTFLEISGKRARQIPLPIAPSDEQQRIVGAIESLLPKLDAAMMALERVRANLKRYRASVLKGAVDGRLVPTEAELARKEGRDFEPASVMLVRIIVERRRRWEESELARMRAAGKQPKDDGWKSKYKEPVAPQTSALPELPDGWCWATALQACEKVIDCHNKTAPYKKFGIALIRTTNVRNGRIQLSDVNYVDEATYEFWSRRCPPEEGDIIFTREAPMGEAGIIPPGVKLCMGQRMMLLRADNRSLLREYLLNALQAPYVMQIALRAAVGTGVKHMRVGDVERLPVPIPPAAEQSRIVAELNRHVTDIEHWKSVVDASASRCRRLRQSILRWAFEGKLVDQVSNDEPASVLLERIRADRAAATPSAKSRKPRLRTTEAAK